MPSLTQRRLTPEHMDDPAASAEELERALGFLRLINRRLGGIRASLAPFQTWQRAWQPGESISVLDVGTGSADVPLALLDWAKRRGQTMRIVGVDVHSTTLDLARRYVSGRCEEGEIELIECDALCLMERFEPGSFDYVHAGLFLHHLQDIEVMTVLRSMDRLARRGIVWNDLLRTRTAMLGAQLATLMPGVPRTVKHDAIVSIEAAFTPNEAVELAERIGMENIECRTHLLHRFTLTSTKLPGISAA